MLDRLGLVHRLDVGDGTARYEAAHPGGEHHHHVVCDRCGRVAQFSDDGLEQAIATLSQRLEFAIDQHDVVLRGTCPNCRYQSDGQDERGAVHALLGGSRRRREAPRQAAGDHEHEPRAVLELDADVAELDRDLPCRRGRLARRPRRG